MASAQPSSWAGVAPASCQVSAETVAARAVKSAIERDTGSGDGVFLASITDEGVDIVGHKDFDEVLD